LVRSRAARVEGRVARPVGVEPHDVITRRRVAVVAGEAVATDDDFAVGLQRHCIHTAIRSRAARVEGRVARSVGVEPDDAVGRRRVAVIAGEKATNDDLPVGLHRHRPHIAIRSRTASVECRVYVSAGRAGMVHINQ
jgi:hypothetical protein